MQQYLPLRNLRALVPATQELVLHSGSDRQATGQVWLLEEAYCQVRLLHEVPCLFAHGMSYGPFAPHIKVRLCEKEV